METEFLAWSSRVGNHVELCVIRFGRGSFLDVFDSGKTAKNPPYWFQFYAFTAYYEVGCSFGMVGDYGILFTNAWSFEWFCRTKCFAWHLHHRGCQITLVMRGLSALSKSCIGTVCVGNSRTFHGLVKLAGLCFCFNNILVVQCHVAFPSLLKISDAISSSYCRGGIKSSNRSG